MNYNRLLALFLGLLYSTASVLGDDWDSATLILEKGISNHYYPGCTALVADSTGILYTWALGNFTYGVPPPMDPNSVPAEELDVCFIEILHFY